MSLEKKNLSNNQWNIAIINNLNSTKWKQRFKWVLPSRLAAFRHPNSRWELSNHINIRECKIWLSDDRNQKKLCKSMSPTYLIYREHLTVRRGEGAKVLTLEWSQAVTTGASLYPKWRLSLDNHFKNWLMIFFFLI